MTINLICLGEKVHCPGVTVSSAHFHSQKVLANYGYSTNSQLQNNYIFKFYKFSVQSGTGNTKCH